MKRFIFTMLLILVFTSMAYAQSNGMLLYPKTEGATMVTRNYDANDNLRFTTTYIVQESSETDIKMSYSVTNNAGQVVEQGNLDAYFQNGNFYLKTVGRSTCPEIDEMLASNTQLIGSYLDYPNTFDMNPFDGVFEKEGAEFTVRDKDEKKDFINVRVYNRSYKKNEKITTPAGTFDASKISFYVEVYDNETKETKRYKNTEWYALGAGIVRTESFDHKDNLVSYTVLESLEEK